jgi:predicted secreted protein
MKWTSILAIYLLFWMLTLFAVLPFGVRTHDEEGTKAEIGHAESAPVNFSFGRVALRTTIVSAVLMAIFYLNYVNGWIDAHMLGWDI